MRYRSLALGRLGVYLPCSLGGRGMRLAKPFLCRAVLHRLRLSDRRTYIFLLVGDGEEVTVDDSNYIEAVAKCVV